MLRALMVWMVTFAIIESAKEQDAETRFKQLLAGEIHLGDDGPGVAAKFEAVDHSCRYIVSTGRALCSRAVNHVFHSRFRPASQSCAARGRRRRPRRSSLEEK